MRCGFTILSKGSFLSSNEFFVNDIPSELMLLVMRQHSLSSPLRFWFDIMTAGLSFAPVRSEYGKGVKMMSLWLYVVPAFICFVVPFLL